MSDAMIGDEREREREHEAEFVRGAEPPARFAQPLSRRGFLKAATASAALAALGCSGRIPAEIVPRPGPPPEQTPGRPLFYATTFTLDGYGIGLLAESHEGRPTKVEGNPDHPASLGATGAFEQASVRALYDPRRARALRRGAEPATFEALLAAFGIEPAGGAAPRSGAGLALLLEPTASPLVASLVGRIREALPGAMVHFHTPLAGGGGIEATRALLGRPLVARPRLEAASRVLSLDADLLGAGPFALRHARGFARRRDPDGGAEMCRLYAVEPGLSITGAAADHRLARRASDVAAIAGAVLAEVLALLPGRAREARAGLADVLRRLREGAEAKAAARFVGAVARDLVAAGAGALVVAGERQPAATHAIALLLCDALGALGTTVELAEPAIFEAGLPSHGLAPLVAAIDRGEVRRLLILEGDPVATAPPDLALRERIAAVAETAYLGAAENATSRACRWLVPAAHYLESWADARAFDGTASIVQPLIEPLFGGRTTAEVLAALLPPGPRAARELVRERWRDRPGVPEAERGRAFTRALERGVIPGTRIEPLREARLDPARAAALLAEAATPAPRRGLEAVFAPSASLHDGRFAGQAHLLELPDPVTTLTWENAALVGPALAATLGAETGRLADLSLEGATVRAPLLVVPGIAEGAVVLPLGHAPPHGFDAYALRSSAAPHFRAGLSVSLASASREPVTDPTPRPAHRDLALAQRHGSLEGRDHLREGTLAEHRADPGAAARRPSGHTLRLYEPAPSDERRWGMAVDLTRCTGCAACVAACDAENNVPAVGRDDALAGRLMHWLRIDRYFAGPPADPRVLFQPMLCQHCESAPCEYVCPVGATAHSRDGLNEQVYNRCVGTRFCSNNCPYKVRRFNWFSYSGGLSPHERLAMNPDVTVRDRGVMEKCTFCVQRIRRAEIDAEVAGRPREGVEVTTACQQACAAEAIVFGPASDPGSRVAALWRSPRAYAALEEKGTRPRIRYLARIRNPNPELA